MKKILTLAILVAFVSSAKAEIIFPVDVETTRWSVYDTDISAIIKRNVRWPALDGNAIPGLAANLVMLEQVSDIAPAYDTRTHRLNTSEVISIPDNEVRTTYSISDRPNNQIVNFIRERELEEVNSHGINISREILQTRIMLAIILEYGVDINTYPTKAKNFATTYKARAVKLRTNRDRAAQLISDANADLPVDLDAGWEAP